MFRKNLCSAVLAAATLITSVCAQAHINYRRDQWLDPVAKGRTSDLYIGAQLGYVKSNWQDIEDSLDIAGLGTASGVRSDFTDANFGGRLFVRWDFTKHFGIEGGLSYIDGSEATLNNVGMNALVEIRDPEPGNPNYFKDKNTIYIVDATWVSRIELENSFTFYTKFGANLMLVKSAFSFRTLDGPAGKRFIFSGDDNSNLSITFGLGLNYRFSDSFVGDLSYQYFRGNDKSGDFIADVNMFMMGIAWHIPLDTCTKSCL